MAMELCWEQSDTVCSILEGILHVVACCQNFVDVRGVGVGE
jgi:hypothetical protein